MNKLPVRNAFIMLNPIAGQASPATIHAALERYFTYPNWAYTVHEISAHEDVAELTRAACRQGADLVVAAGGDGTVVAVANGLVKCQIPLGILPLGTGNGFARGLNIPLKMDNALELLVGEPDIKQVDALQVSDRCYVLNVSVGLSPQIMRNTKPEQKRRLGVLAYIWTLFKRWGSFRVRGYKVTVDGKPRWIIGSEILISNGTVLDSLSSLVGPPETFADNQLRGVYRYSPYSSRLSAIDLECGASPAGSHPQAVSLGGQERSEH